jgi:glutamine amidotransferase
VSARSVGIVDYGVGNHTSLSRAVLSLGFKCRVTDQAELLDKADLIILPGVGSFPSAAASLTTRGLFDYLRDRANRGSPLLGICLGMQILGSVSLEFGETPGLGLIPGRVVRIGEMEWHIGWNTVEVVGIDPLFRAIDGKSFYFNHSFVFEEISKHTVGIARLREPLVVAVRRDNVVGLQFHPEKSQSAGLDLLKGIIDGLCDA